MYFVYKSEEFFFLILYTVEPGHNDISLCDTSSIASDIVWNQLIPCC
jgi:hypothetical protein